MIHTDILHLHMCPSVQTDNQFRWIMDLICWNCRHVNAWQCNVLVLHRPCPDRLRMPEHQCLP
eukprot:2569648-Prorocentrum_lima.AAC.1